MVQSKILEVHEDIDFRHLLKDHNRKKEYQGNPNPLAGHCYVASEIYYHLFLYRTHEKWRPQFLRWEGQPHWYLKNLLNGDILDVTKSQFITQPNYSLGRGKGFLTRKPSQRAQIVLDIAMDRY